MVLCSERIEIKQALLFKTRNQIKWQQLFFKCRPIPLKPRNKCTSNQILRGRLRTI